MSEVKVNKISPRTACGTVTLGDSGDTFTVPSGATISNLGTATGFGGTGVVSWNTTKITADPSPAVTGTGYFCDTSGGAFTVTLPASPSAGDVVGVSDYAKTFDTNALTLGRNSKPIGGQAFDGTLTTEGLAATLVYVDSTKGWIVTDSGLQSDVPGPIYVAATGGTVATVCTNYKTHTFTAPGTLVVTCGGNAAGSNTVDYFVVAGGGGGGGRTSAGGGGAGGFRLSNTTCMSVPLTSPLVAPNSPSPAAVPVTATPYAITVGGGGPGGAGGCTPSFGTSGSDSIFSSITSAGGGGGGCWPNPGSSNGLAGGSGGGGGGPAGSGGAGDTPSTTPDQGFAGGDGGGGGCGGGGGGGGAAVGANASPPNCGGAGGIGSFVVQTGFGGCNGTPGPVPSTRYFAGGGGGRSGSGNQPGGDGGGGTGASNSSGQDCRSNKQWRRWRWQWWIRNRFKWRFRHSNYKVQISIINMYLHKFKNNI